MGFLVNKNNSRLIYCAFYFFALILSLIACARGGTPDTAIYVDIYKASNFFPFDPFDYYSTYGVEVGFGIASYVLQVLGMDVRVLFFLVSWFIFVCIGIASRNFGLNPMMVLPYYVGSFYLTQQFTQIRQALSVSVVFLLISFLVKIPRNRNELLVVFLGIVGVLFHVISVLVIVVGWIVFLYIGKLQVASKCKRKILFSCGVVFVCVVVACRLAMAAETVLLFARLQEYIVDDQFGLGRGLWEVANVRACLYLAIICTIAKCRLYGDDRFLILLFVFTWSVAIRLGFFDFAIVSGRVAGALSFSEIFIIPIVVGSAVRNRFLRCVIPIAYLVFHAFIVLQYQAPYLIDTFFDPV